MSQWDSDIASLLDDVLQDKEPEVKQEPEAQQSAPPQPETGVVAEDADLSIGAPIPGHDEPLSSQDDAHNKLAKLAEQVDPKDVVNVCADDMMNTTLADLMKEDDEPHELAPESVEAIAEVTGATPEQVQEGWDKSAEVTTVVNEDVEKAKLPKIDTSAWSQPVDETEHVPIPQFTDDELMESIDIRNFGTLVSLTNRRWQAKIKDRKAAKDAAAASGAEGEAFEARKRLLVGADEKLKAVHKCIDAARTDHYAMTLPWSTVGINDIGKRAGPRLLPNTRFFDYVQTMGKHKLDMQQTLDAFVQAYPTLIAIAQQKLGSAFNQADYPRPEVIEQYFTLEFDFDPIPVGSDYQGLQDAQVQKLAAALQKKTQTKLENALGDAWKRVYEDVSHAARVLTNPDAMFHYTLVDKLRNHVSELKHLNVINDARIEEIRVDVERDLTKHDVKDVRDDDALRKRLGEAATAIREKMEAYAT